MDKNKQERLEAAGWTVAGPKEFLNLTDEDEAYIEVKMALAAAVKALRLGQELSQVEAAGRLRSSQSRVAKMEAADRSVSVDLLVRAFLKLGGTRATLLEALRLE